MTWLDRAVQYPNRFTLMDNGDGTYTLTPAPGTVTEAGTPLNASNLNHIEQGIAGALPMDGSGTMTGDIRFDMVVSPNAQGIRFGDGTGWRFPIKRLDGTIIGYIEDDGDLFLTTNFYKVWTSGNDGAGSGLDADLLDGKNSDINPTANTVAVRDGSGNIAALGNMHVTNSGEAMYHLFNNGAIAEWKIGQRSFTDHACKISKVVSGVFSDYFSVEPNGDVNVFIGDLYYRGTALPGMRLNGSGSSAFVEFWDGSAWRGVGGLKNVQRGTSALLRNPNTNQTVTNITISAVNLSKTFITLSFGNYDNSGDTGRQIRARLTSSTNLEVTLYHENLPAGTDTASQLSWEVAENY